MRLLILRPEPGASETAARARALGLDAVVAPLFIVRPLACEPVDAARYQALLLTSANAARHAPPGLEALPVFAVGEATAAAAAAAGFSDVRVGPSDGSAAAREMVEAGTVRALHLCGRDHVALAVPGMTVERGIVYAADPGAPAPEAWRGPAVALIHSARAGARFAEVAGGKARIHIAAISARAADAAGGGWASKAVAAEPRDAALLELAAKLCNHDAEARTRA